MLTEFQKDRLQFAAEMIGFERGAPIDDSGALDGHGHHWNPYENDIEAFNLMLMMIASGVTFQIRQTDVIISRPKIHSFPPYNEDLFIPYKFDYGAKSQRSVLIEGIIHVAAEMKRGAE